MAGRSALAAAGNLALCLSGKPLVGFTTVDGRIDFVALRCNEAVGACKCLNLSLYDYSESCECPVGVAFAGAGEAKVPCDALVVLGGLERAAVFRPRRLQRRKRRLHMLRWVPFLSALLDSVGLNLNAPLKQVRREQMRP